MDCGGTTPLWDDETCLVAETASLRAPRARPFELRTTKPEQSSASRLGGLGLPQNPQSGIGIPQLDTPCMATQNCHNALRLSNEKMKITKCHPVRREASEGGRICANFHAAEGNNYNREQFPGVRWQSGLSAIARRAKAESGDTAFGNTNDAMQSGTVLRQKMLFSPF